MIRLECISANPKIGKSPVQIKYFSSYTFDRSVLTPASAFRFTAPGVDKDTRLAIRSGDQINLYVSNERGKDALLAVGFVDETDTHITANSLEYVITGRDMVGQLVDNDAVDVNNAMIFFEKVNIDTLVTQLLKNTRMVQSYLSSQIDKSIRLAVSTSPNETKINVLQRYMDFLNGLVWANNNGELIVDKPNFTQNPSGSFVVSESDPSRNNVLESRVRRNVNQAIRQIVTQLNGTEAAGQKEDTVNNMDQGLKPYRGTNVGRSVSRLFSYATGTDTINQGQGVGLGSYAPHTLAREYSAREIARENMKILDVEIVVEGHFNAIGYIYNVDQVYQVQIEDEDVREPMYVYSVSYELTIDHGMITRMRLCRLFTICAYTNLLDKVVSK